MAGFKMDDYVPVNERIAQFYSAFPDGSIQSEIVELTASRVTFRAYAYRKPDDPRPGTGHSSLEIPGSTPYTRGSEIENCETSAWGRAIAALGFEVKRGIASAEEVRNKTQPPQAPPSGDPRARLAHLAMAHRLTRTKLDEYADAVGVPKGERATPAQIEQIIALIETPGSSVPTASPATDTRDEHPSSGGATPARQPEAVAPPPGDAPAADLTLEEIVAATGGELLPKVDPAIQERIDRANTRAKKVAV